MVPAIKESIAAKALSPLEIDALRSRALFIKKKGHETYLTASPSEIALQVFEGSKKLD